MKFFVYDLYMNTLSFVDSNKDKKYLILLSVYLIGLLFFAFQIDIWALVRDLSQSNEGIYKLKSSWWFFWIFLTVGSLIGAVVARYFLSYLFYIRVCWSGNSDINLNNSNKTYFLLGLIKTLPFLLMLLVVTVINSSYAEYVDNFFYYFLIQQFFSFIYILRSYQLVVIIFDLHKAKAFIWFVLVPLVFQLWLIFSLFMLANR